jgi:hypothetical protein
MIFCILGIYGISIRLHIILRAKSCKASLAELSASSRVMHKNLQNLKGKWCKKWCTVVKEKNEKFLVCSAPV